MSSYDDQYDDLLMKFIDGLDDLIAHDQVVGYFLRNLRRVRSNVSEIISDRVMMRRKRLLEGSGDTSPDLFPEITI